MNWRRSKASGVILVQGAWAIDASWAEIIPSLQAAGLDAMVARMPLTSLAAAAAELTQAIAAHDGEVILVGHSYGGAVISQAGSHPKVVGLVYIAAYAPDIGESAPSSASPASSSEAAGGQQAAPAAITWEPATLAAWKVKPSWYIVASNDETVSLELQSSVARNINAVTIAIPSGHLPMLAWPKDVAEIILEAAGV